MKVNKNTRIFWAKAGWLPRHYLDFIPETLIKRGWNITVNDEWVTGDNKINIPDTDMIFCHGPSVTRYLVSGKNKYTETPPQVHHIWDVPTFRKWDNYWWHFTVLEMEAIKRNAHTVFTLSQSVSDVLKTSFDIDSTPALQCFDNRIVESVEANKRAKPYVLSATHHRDSKNLHTLILGFAMFLEESKKDVRLVITGDKGGNTQFYKKLGMALNVPIEWTGSIPDHETVVSLIKGADMLVHPSLFEGFGLAPKEAIWANVPTVVADIPVMREIHKDNVAYVNPVDPNSIAHVLYNHFVKNKLPYDKKKARKTIAPYAMLPQITKFEKQLSEINLGG